LCVLLNPVFSGSPIVKKFVRAKWACQGTYENLCWLICFTFVWLIVNTRH
jgi:hypothetical protein